MDEQKQYQVLFHFETSHAASYYVYADELQRLEAFMRKTSEPMFTIEGDDLKPIETNNPACLYRLIQFHGSVEYINFRKVLTVKITEINDNWS